MTPRLVSIVACVLATFPGALARGTQSPNSAGPQPDLALELAAWRARHGPQWRLAVDAETGHMEMLYGGRTAASIPPRTDDDYVVIARNALNEAQAMHGLEAATLVPVRALFLPLNQIGSGDKETVRFREEVNGVRVVGGFVNVLMSARGEVLSIQSAGLPHLAGLATSPRVDARRAAALAGQDFRNDTGLAPTQSSQPELVIAQVHAGESRHGRLAWQVDVEWHAADEMPRGFTYWIDAADGATLDREESILSFDVTGTVKSMASPGLLPDVASNPETSQAMPYMTVASSAGTVTTDANGDFTFPGVSSPLACTVTYAGSFNGVTNNGAAPYSLTATLPPNQANTITMNPSSQASVTSQANAFRVVDLLRDFVRAINPSDTTADFVATANCNLAQTCNAYFDGGAINFFASGGGCPNTAYSTVISHEHGHWMNARYGTGNGGDGMGEGNADVWAMYVHDTPIIGQNFSGSGFLRTGNNLHPFCGDTHPSCYGEVHADGEPWMGAAWKVRNRLNGTLGNALGDLVANNLFLGWMNAYNQTKIRSIIEVQWLTLDDDDGNIYDGTPHFGEIDGGFRDQSFPGVTLPFVTIAQVTAVSSTEDQVGPYAVSAMIASNFNPPITTATLHYRANGGSFASVPMSSQGGGMYQAAIPGETAPSHVEYYVSAVDSAAHAAAYPDGAPAALSGFDVGVVHVVRFDNFDASFDNGWSHGALAGTDDWQRAIPGGKSGVSGGIDWSDPASDATSGKCWGNQLGLGGSSGAYSADSQNWLRSPSIDCSGATGTRLRFKRWLSTEGSANDRALIKINGTEVYANPAAEVVDATWTNQEIDISSVADHSSSVVIEWSLQSDAATQLGGWNIDDVQVLWIGIPCPPAVHFCAAAPNSSSASGATLGSHGSTLVSNNDLQLLAFSVPPDKTCLFFYGPIQISPVPFGNGFRCIGNPLIRLPSTQSNFVGDAAYSLDLTALPANGRIGAGQVWNFQLWYRDPAAGGANFNASDGLSLTFCP
jgi:hypothetical protein